MERKNLPLSLIAAGCAILLIAVAIFSGQNYANNLEQKYIHAIAPLHPDSVINGSALEKVALKNPDLLPVYGASENLIEPGKFQASQFFQNYPTGFNTFVIAKGYEDSLTEALELGSVGKSLAGKKVVITFTPEQFTKPMISAKQYKYFFTGLHANEFIFSPYLKYSTKQMMAEHMQKYPATLQNDPLLSFAIGQLRQSTWLSKILYWMSYPLGRIQANIMELQDNYQSVSYILRNKQLLDNDQPRVVPANINWQVDLAAAHNQAVQEDGGNPFGFSAHGWRIIKKKHLYHKKTYGAGDKKYLESLKKSPEASIFSLELEVLKELGAKPLLVGRPLNDKYFNANGISNNALNEYYATVDSIAKKYDMPIVDFKNLQNDIYFGVDPAPHTSPEGWVYIDQIYNNFYHGKNTKIFD